MTIKNDELPEVAKNGFFYCTNKHYGRYVAMAPIKETAKRLYCCEVHTEEVSSTLNCDIETVVKVPGKKFRRGCQGTAYVYVVPKGDYPKTNTIRLDWGR